MEGGRDGRTDGRRNSITVGGYNGERDGWYDRERVDSREQGREGMVE
jgi:hypothetical protein